MISHFYLVSLVFLCHIIGVSGMRNGFVPFSESIRHLKQIHKTTVYIGIEIFDIKKRNFSNPGRISQTLITANCYPCQLCVMLYVPPTPTNVHQHSSY